VEWSAAIALSGALLTVSIGTVLRRRSASGLLVWGGMLLRLKPIESHPDKLGVLNR